MQELRFKSFEISKIKGVGFTENQNVDYEIHT